MHAAHARGPARREHGSRSTLPVRLGDICKAQALARWRPAGAAGTRGTVRARSPARTRGPGACPGIRRRSSASAGGRPRWRPHQNGREARGVHPGAPATSIGQPGGRAAACGHRHWLQPRQRRMSAGCALRRRRPPAHPPSPDRPRPADSGHWPPRSAGQPPPDAPGPVVRPAHHYAGAGWAPWQQLAAWHPALPERLPQTAQTAIGTPFLYSAGTRRRSSTG